MNKRPDLVAQTRENLQRAFWNLYKQKNIKRIYISEIAVKSRIRPQYLLRVLHGHLRCPQSIGGFAHRDHQDAGALQSRGRERART